MNSLRHHWDRAFETRPAAGFELLLFIFLLAAIRRSFSMLTMPDSVFFSADIFDEAAIGYRPVAWMSCLPHALVISRPFQNILSLVTLLSSLAWAAKRLLPYSPIICTISFGLLVSLEQSRLFNYTHRNLVPVWILCVFALAYVCRRRDFQHALRRGDFWSRPIYPAWTLWLLILYLGVQYTASGVTKLWIGGWEAGSGLKLQILIYRANSTFGELRELNILTRLMLEQRWLATTAMTGAVVLETGAILGLTWHRLRPWWAAGLVGFHIAIIMTMHIPFIFNVILLTWLTLPVEAAVDRCRPWIHPRLTLFKRRPQANKDFD